MLAFAVLDHLLLFPLRWRLFQYFNVLRMLSKMAYCRLTGKKMFASVLETETRFETRVWPGEIDFFGHMNTQNYMEKVEEGLGNVKMGLFP